jgi:UDP-N-acetylglucosamine 2-epimerase (non-hydrolysing)/GDP/UDP-N,N'-diacetylbacillosamine 2-epimerase (hydrolysing)
MTKKVVVVSTSRADYSHLYWPLVRMLERPELDVQLVTTGAHLSPEFGKTGEALSDLDVRVTEIESLLSSDSDVGMAKTIGVATLGMADALAKIRPDLLVLVADRYEMLAPAAVALALRIPIAHIEGGEISEGAIDDAVRNALTKMSHLHFTPTEQARRRVIAMGEEEWRVHRTGAPSIDFLTNADLLARPALEATLSHSLGAPIIVIAYHPLTLAADTLVECDAFFAALDKIEGQIVFCFPNADAGSRAIVAHAREFCAARPDAHLHVNLPPLAYWSLLDSADVMLGNSSSGIMETPSLRLSCVNVGDRQLGRQRAANIIDVPADANAIIAAVDSALSTKFRDSLADLENPYGDGHASELLASLLVDAPDRDTLLHKRAMPTARCGKDTDDD